MKISILLHTVLAVISITASGQSTEKNIYSNLKEGIALQGYDPVAYFVLHKAIEGKDEFTFTYHGSTYRFSSSNNRDLFVKNPTGYEPQYGGWCAYAMGATGEKVEIDPSTFKITDGKLYLFYNSFFNNTLPKWNKEENTLKIKADKNWKTLLNKSL